MSAPDYDDPKSKLKLRLRPMSGSETMLKWGSVLGGIGAALCLCCFVVSFIPGAQSDGDPWILLAGAAGSAGFSAVFYLGRKLARLLR